MAFLHISAPKAVLMGYIALYSEIIAHILLKSWNHGFSLTKTEVTRRVLWAVGALLGLKIGSVATPGAHKNTVKRAFSVHLGSKGRSYGLQCPV